MAKIILIGTSHKYQTGCEKTESIEQFRHVLISLCSDQRVTAIAEEMNQSALSEEGASKSVACVLAAELKLLHQLSDPLPEVRNLLGIRSENEIRAHGFLSNWTDQQIESEIHKSHEIRKQYWFNQLQILNSWPLLFVCGANHVESFSALLRSNGFEVIVPFADWEPNSDVENIERQGMVSLETVLEEAQKNNRVCPQPQNWQQLYEMLPDKESKGASREPALPLILAAWWDTPAMSKMLRLREHIEWAATHGCLEQVYSFLKKLPESQWHHIGE